MSCAHDIGWKVERYLDPIYLAQVNWVKHIRVFSGL
jgi:hypothetical protein